MIIAWFVAFVLVLGLLVLAMLVGGYRWGRFAAYEVCCKGSAKWKAYVLALVPAAAFSLGIHFDQSVSSMAGGAFFAVAAAAVFGVLYGWDPDRFGSLG